tara:strand:+ start:147 stop:377 length:231 start_codon:yes stop_codon:yes gene_type:complete
MFHFKGFNFFYHAFFHSIKRSYCFKLFFVFPGIFIFLKHEFTIWAFEIFAEQDVVESSPFFVVVMAGLIRYWFCER